MEKPDTPPVPRILIAEDEKVSRRLLQSTLQKWEYEVVATEDGEQAWAELEKPDCPSLAILDWIMPGLEGPEICRKLREADRQTYVILLTAKGDKEDIVAGLDAGADDFVAKPFNRAELRARLDVGQRIVNLQQELAKRIQDLTDLNAKLEEMSYLDPLTQLPNRRQMEVMLDREWSRAMRIGHSLAVIMIDIDSFKLYNDKYGHPAGDQCLQKVSNVLRDTLRRGSDFVARYGGEEFLVILPETDEKQALQTAQRLCDSVREAGIEQEGGRAGLGVVTISLGVTVGLPVESDVLADFLKQADTGLYEAKENGGNQPVLNK